MTHVRDGIELRRRAHEYQPDVIVLDWRMGGQLWRAIDEVPAIVSRTDTHPYVIAVLPTTSRSIEKEAARSECYDVVSLRDSRFGHQIAEAVSTATLARLARRPGPFHLKRADLH